ncbi:MAG: hypothetical protein R2684_06435 [Pyrinomonadaceae bacterium]
MIFHSDVEEVDRSRVQRAVADILTYGDSFHKKIARFIDKTELVLFVGPVSVVRGSGSVQLDDMEAARLRVLDGELGLREAASYVRLNIARETIDTGGQQGIEGTLVHEGKHAMDFALMLSSFSFGGERIFNPDAFQKEFSAHLTAAYYMWRRGGTFIDEGVSLGLLEKNGDLVRVSPDGIRDRLKRRYGLSPETPGSRLETASNPPISSPRKKWLGLL